MFKANFVITNDKLSYYIMHKHLIIDSEVFAKEFDMDANLPKLIASSFLDYNKDLTISILFPY